MSQPGSTVRGERGAQRQATDANLRAAIRLLHATRQPMAIGRGPDLRELHNAAFAEITGAATTRRRGGRSMGELCGDLWPRLKPWVDAALYHGESAVLEDLLFCNYRHGYAEESYLTCSCSPLTEECGAIGGVMVAVTESTEHVLSMRRTAALREVAAAAATSRSVRDSFRDALVAVERRPADIPFALLYLRDRDRNRLRLLGTAALPSGMAASPGVIELSAEDRCGWPVSTALRTNEPVVVDDLLTRFGALPAGEWPFAPRTALVVPLTSPGCDEPDAVLVAGVSARHVLDAPYRAFIDLVTKQIAAAIAGGRLHEDQRRHAAARAAAQLARAKRQARMRAMRARFEERTRLAREIHDTLLQGVTGIALQLGVVLPRVRTSPDEATAMLEHIIELAITTSRDARQAVWDMRPTALDDNAFLRAVEATARRLADHAAVAVELSVSGPVRALPLAHQSVVLRVVQEAVANVVRHADARTIRLRITYGTRRVRLAVTDDGRGFVVEKNLRSYHGHWGLIGMQERAAALGGALAVRSTPGAGSAVILVLPYRRHASRHAARDSTKQHV